MKEESFDEFVNMETILGKTYVLLEKYPTLRDSDKKLVMAYYNVYFNIESEMFNADNPYRRLCEILYQDDVPTYTSIVRVRAKIQEKGHFLGNNKLERLERADAIKDWSVEDKKDY